MLDSKPDAEEHKVNEAEANLGLLSAFHWAAILAHISSFMQLLLPAAKLLNNLVELIYFHGNAEEGAQAGSMARLSTSAQGLTGKSRLRAMPAAQNCILQS